MSWAKELSKRILLSLAMSEVRLMLISVLLIVGFPTQVKSLVDHFFALPLWAQISLVCVCVGAVAVGLHEYLRRPLDPKNPDSLPRHFLLLRFGLRRISWRFGPLLNMYSDHHSTRFVANFPVHLKANWWRELRPIRSYIKSRSTGKTLDICLAGANGYVPISQVDACPSGTWIDGIAEFEPPIPTAEFMQKFGAFDFVFEYDFNHRFVLGVSDSDLRKFFDHWDAFFDRQRKGTPTIRLK